MVKLSYIMCMLCVFTWCTNMVANTYPGGGGGGGGGSIRPHTALFQEVYSSQMDPLAFSATGWMLDEDGQVVMRFVHRWGGTDCALQRSYLSDKELAACWNNVGILQNNYNDSLAPYEKAIAAAADDSAPHFNRAVALHMMGRAGEAAPERSVACADPPCQRVDHL